MANPQITCNGNVASSRSCPYQTFSLDLAYPGRKPEVKQQIVENALNASRVRDISPVLRVSSAFIRVKLKPHAGVKVNSIHPF